jgi:hypothetical protein
MNIPGFTAEASLYRSSEQYYKAGSFEQAGGVVPQQFGVSGLREGQPDRPVASYWTSESCSPCRLVSLRPPYGRKMVRDCLNIVYQSGESRIAFCQLQCHEQSCSPFQRASRPPVLTIPIVSGVLAPPSGLVTEG